MVCSSEDEARGRAGELIAKRRWPCYFFVSDTTGEKPVEEFHALGEVVDGGRFHGIGIIKLTPVCPEEKLDRFLADVQGLMTRGRWQKEDLVRLFEDMVPEFKHQETHKYLDGRM